MAEPDNSDVINIAVIGLGGSFLIVAFVLAVHGLFLWYEGGLEESRFAKTPGALSDHRIEQDGKLQGYRTVDSAKGAVAIPIDRAIELTAKEYSAKK